MCNNTKQKIAAALRQLMTERPFEKITVQNLMDVTQMKRQSFYYHFQDTRDVLQWICRQELFVPLSQSQLPFVDWVMKALTLLDSDRRFYRRVLKASQEDFIREFEQNVLQPRMIDLLYHGQPLQNLDDNQRFAVEFAVHAFDGWLMKFTFSHTPLDIPVARDHTIYLLNTIKFTSR